MVRDRAKVAIMPAAIDANLILESVLTVWREVGYQRATTRKVSSLAGISEMTLFRRFGDKAALFRAALSLEAERFSSQAIEHSGDLETDLEQIVLAYSALLDRSGAIVLDFLLEAPRNPDLAQIRSIPLATMGKVALIIVRHQSEGNLRQGSPFEAILSLLSPLVMSAFLRRAQPEMVPSSDPDFLVTKFLQGWSPTR